jgi:HAD superfamily hydrolase (TIGR01549 family)
VSGAEAGKRAYDDAAAVLQELRGRGLKVGMVTNRAFGGPRFRGDLLAAGLDFEWDAEAVSVEVGYKKPHPRIFEHALAALGLRARAVLMVGNSLAEDVAGAQRLGMAAAWRRSAPDAEGVAPDFVFDELSELLALPGLAGAR